MCFLLFCSYAVIVMVEGQEERVKTWTEVQAMNRLCGSVAKVSRTEDAIMFLVSRKVRISLLLLFDPVITD